MEFRQSRHVDDRTRVACLLAPTINWVIEAPLARESWRADVRERFARVDRFAVKIGAQRSLRSDAIQS
jgi:hypothetical protein